MRKVQVQALFVRSGKVRRRAPNKKELTKIRSHCRFRIMRKEIQSMTTFTASGSKILELNGDFCVWCKVRWIWNVRLDYEVGPVFEESRWAGGIWDLFSLNPSSEIVWSAGASMWVKIRSWSMFQKSSLAWASPWFHPPEMPTSLGPQQMVLMMIFLPSVSR
jgi:hypothetical protein